MGLEVGASYTIERRVEPEHSADKHGNPGVDVFTTPLLCEWSEEAAVFAVTERLELGMITLGTRIELKHLVATPIGMVVRVTATLKEIDGRKLIFIIEAYDEKEKISECTHERFIVTKDRFMQKVAEKAKG
ncbi:MAG: thioesterase family protein [candidate division NC10 bacterium]|jgi:predicted thioesterase|nr:thioesterase [candidate division NC10 bacterium]MCH7896077.1 thioesterase family protein [candidate division NC10 bacterium]MCZ6550689.1 thioesterase family protein [candidate division NC10 bacterium]